MIKQNPLCQSYCCSKRFVSRVTLQTLSEPYKRQKKAGQPEGFPPAARPSSYWRPAAFRPLLTKSLALSASLSFVI